MLPAHVCTPSVLSTLCESPYFIFIAFKEIGGIVHAIMGELRHRKGRELAQCPTPSMSLDWIGFVYTRSIILDFIL